MMNTNVFKVFYSSNPDSSLAIISDIFSEKLNISDESFILVSNCDDIRKKMFLKVKFDPSVHSNTMFLSKEVLKKLGIIPYRTNSNVNITVCDTQAIINYVQILIEPKFVDSDLEVNNFESDEIINDYLFDFFTKTICPLIDGETYIVKSNYDRYNGLAIKITLQLFKTNNRKFNVLKYGKITNFTKLAFVLGKYIESDNCGETCEHQNQCSKSDDGDEFYNYGFTDAIFNVQVDKTKTLDMTYVKEHCNLTMCENILTRIFILLSLIIICCSIIAHNSNLIKT